MEAVALYVSMTLVAMILVEPLLWHLRRKSRDSSLYLGVAAAARSIGYAPALFAAGHGAGFAPFFAGVFLQMGQPGWLPGFLLLNLPLFLIALVIFGGTVLLRQKWPYIHFRRAPPLEKPIFARAYEEKYGITEKDIEDLVARRRLPGRRIDGLLLVEDRPPAL